MQGSEDRSCSDNYSDLLATLALQTTAIGRTDVCNYKLYRSQQRLKLIFGN